MAAFNLLNAIAGKEGLDAARVFYESELRAPAMDAKATEGVRKRRAMAAANIAIGIANGRGLSKARTFYESELQRPAEAAGASDDVRAISDKVRLALGL
jgi:hypothetical protein